MYCKFKVMQVIFYILLKGEMENAGVIRCGQMVTQQTLDDFCKSKIVFRESSEGTWFVTLE